MVNVLALLLLLLFCTHTRQLAASGECTLPKLEGAEPMRRNSSTLSVVPCGSAADPLDRVVVFGGGRYPDIYMNDVHMICIRKRFPLYC